MWTTIKDYWNKFETWVHSWMPGLKTYICTGLGMIGTGAGVLQQYIAGIPADKFVNETQLAIATFVLFSLAFWFHGMGERVTDSTESN